MPSHSPRSTQLDGWRAVGVLGVMWLHWAPRAWRGPLPFEIGLYFFLTLSGFLITRILLKERRLGEESERPWRWSTFRTFQSRRALRIMIPCYLAMLFAIAAQAPDIHDHPWWYFTHLSNFHIALLPQYPSGTAHYWTLAIQQQFYLLWPIFIFLLPRKWLGAFFIACIATAPISRAVLENHFPAVQHPSAVTTSALDYLGTGSLLALIFSKGVQPGDRRLNLTGWITFACYLPLYCLSEAGIQLPVLAHLQQTFLSFAMIALISATLAGLPGIIGRLLESHSMQHLGKISYGLYLFHATIPMALGWIVPFLWNGGDSQVMLGLRILVFALASWAIAWLCWRYVEVPLAKVKQRLQ
ncbi:acyltransferase family protein [Haloferula chungangensis]|uniref:Acyltransferase family protein n=1 Tax=Haloferula chungangensis TaxID=1048331 RepID=A0ABW2L9G0_9BACT